MIDIEAVYQAMLKGAPKAFGDAWEKVRVFLPAELRKMSIQMAEITGNVAKFKADPSQGYPAATGQVLMRMQRRSLEAVLIAVTALTLIAVEEAVNAIIDAARTVAGTVLDAIV